MPKQAHPKTGKRTVFIVEDDAFLIKAYQIKFEKEKAEVWTATDGDEARKIISSRGAPNVVLLDLMLPGTDGFELLKMIRDSATWGNVPVLILTNLGQPQDMEKGQALHATDYLIKADTKIEDIVNKVKVYL